MRLHQAKGLRLASYREVYFLTGAGISVGSGLPRYRSDSHTLPTELAEVLDGDRLPNSLPQVWAWARGMASAVAASAPNRAYFVINTARRALAERGKPSTLATMNVDGLHQRAGDDDALELHGNVLRVRCTLCEQDSHPGLLSFPGSESPPSCLECGAPLRPDVVLYREQPDPYATWQSKRALRDADLMIIVGTSARVSTVDTVMRAARFSGARTVGVNPTRPTKDANPGYTEFHQGPAEEILPDLLTL